VIRRILALDGVLAVCQFRDDGTLLEGYGLLPDPEMIRLARFAHDYRRMLQANADQLSMFTQVRGWTPPRGWIVHGTGKSVCCAGNVVCVIDNTVASLEQVYGEVVEVSRY
jgi:roadblock/LC7 domain-containing protein